MDTNRPIGVFDSGLGGLSVLRKLVKTLPYENYIYFGDTARVPYGEKTREELLQFSREILDWFKSQNIKAVLMACNTSSAVTLNVVKDKYDFPVLGLIEPTARRVAALNEQKIGLIATSATVKSKAYLKAIIELNPQKEVFAMACPGLVEIVESGDIESEGSRELVKKYISPLIDKGVEKLILGCTHYPYLDRVISQLLGKEGMLIDPADFLVEETQNTLKRLDLLSVEGWSRKYFISGSASKFAEVGSKFIDEEILAETLNLAKTAV